MPANTGPWSLGATDVLGSVFELTTSTRLEEISFFHPSDVGGSYEFAVYRSSSGPSTLGPDGVSLGPALGETQWQWRSVGPLGIDLDANYGGLGSTHYMFALAGTAGMEFGKYTRCLSRIQASPSARSRASMRARQAVCQSLPQTNFVGLEGLAWPSSTVRTAWTSTSMVSPLERTVTTAIL